MTDTLTTTANHLYGTAEIIDEQEFLNNHAVAILYKDDTYYLWFRNSICQRVTEYPRKEDAEKAMREEAVLNLDDEDLAYIQAVDMGSDHEVATIEYDGRFYCRLDSPDHREATEYLTEEAASKKLSDEIAEIALMFSDEHDGTHWESLDGSQWVVTHELDGEHIVAWRLDGESDYGRYSDRDDAEERAESLLLGFGNSADTDTAEKHAAQAMRLDEALAESAAAQSSDRRADRHIYDALFDIAMDPDGLPLNVAKLADHMGVSRKSVYRWYPFLSNKDDTDTAEATDPV